MTMMMTMTMTMMNFISVSAFGGVARVAVFYSYLGMTE